MAKRLTRPLWLWLTAVIFLNTLLCANGNDQCFSQHTTPYENYNSCCSGSTIGSGSTDDVHFTYECDSYATPYGVKLQRGALKLVTAGSD